MTNELSQEVLNERHRCAQMVRDAIVMPAKTQEEMEARLRDLAEAIEKETAMNYRIYLQGSTGDPVSMCRYKSESQAQAGIEFWESAHPEWKGKIEARPDTGQVKVRYGKPGEGNPA